MAFVLLSHHFIIIVPLEKKLDAVCDYDVALWVPIQSYLSQFGVGVRNVGRGYPRPGGIFGHLKDDFSHFAYFTNSRQKIDESYFLSQGEGLQFKDGPPDDIEYVRLKFKASDFISDLIA